MAVTITDHVVALWRLQHAYADVVTRRAWSELNDLFLPDTTVHLDTVTGPPREIAGPEAFGSFVAGAIERYDHFTFVILNAVVDVDEQAGAATGRIFMCEVRHDVTSDTWQNAHGVYRDRYVLTSAGWRIAERHYRSMARTGPDGAVFPLPPGFA